MDRLTAFVASAHLKLRLEILSRHPEYLEDTPNMVLQIAKPMELAGLKGRLERAKLADADIADTGKRFDVVLDKIDELRGAAKSHVGDLEKYSSDLESMINGMVAGSNGAPEDPTAPEAPPLPGPAGGPRIL